MAVRSLHTLCRALMLWTVNSLAPGYTKALKLQRMAQRAQRNSINTQKLLSDHSHLVFSVDFIV